MSIRKTETGMIFENVRFSYANVFEPKAIQGSEPKYSVAILIPKSDAASIQMVKECIQKAKEEGVSKFGGKIPPVLKEPLRDGDVEHPGDEVYEGHYFVNATSFTPPQVVKINPAEPNKLLHIGPDEFYSGCYGKASVNFYAFNKNSKGIACGLNNLMKTHDGDKLSGGGSTAAQDFGLDEDGDEFI